MLTPLTRTFQTRIPDHQPELNAAGDLFGQLERKLFTEITSSTKSINDLKKQFIATEGITARHFNSIRIQVQGKIDGVREGLKLHITITEQKLKTLNTKLKSLNKKAKIELNDAKRRKIQFEIHHRKRRQQILVARLKHHQARIDAANPGLCFGSRRLFNAQHHLYANGYDSHADWQSHWKNSRNNNIFLVGSKDETAGNQTCQASVAAADQSISLRLRLPDRLGFSKYISFHGLRFAYGHTELTAAIATNTRGAGVPITWRFLRDTTGWRVFASVTQHFEPQIDDSAPNGTIGIDINADHLAVAVTDRHGNPIAYRRFNTPVGLTSEQTKAIMGDACKTIVDLAVQYRTPLVIEKIDFSKKKAQLETNVNARKARMLSSFAYNQFKTMLRSRAIRHGVPLKEINPAYTSVIGAVKFAKRYGVSVHLSAALAIARRGMSLSERIPCQPGTPLGDGSHVALDPPVRMGRRHVWKSWAVVARGRNAVLAGHFRSVRMSRSLVARAQAPATSRPTLRLTGANPVTQSLTLLFGRRNGIVS